MQSSRCGGTIFRLGLEEEIIQDPCRSKFSRQSRRWRLDHESSVASTSVGPCTEDVEKSLKDMERTGPSRWFLADPADARLKMTWLAWHCSIKALAPQLHARFRGQRQIMAGDGFGTAFHHAKSSSAKPHERLRALFCRIGSARESTEAAR